MCGIAGVVGSVRDEDREDVRRMCSAMRHRGPDDEGYFDADYVCLGMRRLSIVDVAGGHQPVFDEGGGIAAVFNGEIYNYRDLRRRLLDRGHRFSSSSDAECIPHLYVDDGTSFVDQLRGMFAIALWDARLDQLVLVRDRVGKKPLYLAHEGGRLWFASELKCLLEVGGVPRDIDLEAIRHYLTYQYVPAPWSPFRGIRKLPPAHRLVWKSGTSTTQRYWRLSYGNRAPELEEAMEETRVHILDATRARMQSERPLGAFLSGGIDSSAVVAAMAMNSSKPVQTYSIGFGDETHDELPYARRVAELYGTIHHEFVVKPDVADLLPRLARAFDEPFADDSAVPSFHVAEMASRDLVVVLNGDGGDESFAGYDRYSNFLKAMPRASFPAFGERLVPQGLERIERKLSPGPRASRLVSLASRMSAATPARRYARSMSFFAPEELRVLFRQDAGVDEVDSLAIVTNEWDTAGSTDVVNRLLATDLSTYLPGALLPKVDITTMSFSLEARSPFLDQDLMEWAASLSGSLKIRDGQKKFVLRQALQPWLPPEILDRPKRGFSMPTDKWLRTSLAPVVADLLLSPNAAIFEYLDREEVRRVVARHQRTGVGGAKVWALLMLELWHREVVAA